MKAAITIGIELPRERLEAFCRANGIRRLALFGSVLRDDFRPESDIDVLVEFLPGVHVGLSFIRLQDELTALRQDALKTLSASELRDDPAASCFIEMCHALTAKMNAKLTRQHQSFATEQLLAAIRGDDPLAAK